jgi:tetratricopeptide (TPR) repeat protein
VLLLSLAGLVGCGGGSATRDGSVLELPVEIVSLGSTVSDEALAQLSDAALFADGNALLREGAYAEALRRYRLLQVRSSDDDYVRAAYYNTGLCLEGLDDYEGASRIYEEVVERWPASDDATDALYRWAESRSQLGDYEGVLPIMQRALRRARLTLVDRTEAHLRLANAAIELRDYALAEQNYRAVLRANAEARLEARTDESAERQPLPDYHPILAQAHFGLGRAYHELFLEIKLVLPQAAIERALLDKAQLMEQARLAYLDAVRAGHIYWSVAAGFMIGQIYEDFYLDVLACEVPADFEGLVLEVYFEELRAFLRPVVQRALDVYEDNLSMAHRMGADSVWVEETEMGIERVQRYLFDETTQQEQERLILQQQHPHSARDRNRVHPAALELARTPDAS